MAETSLRVASLEGDFARLTTMGLPLAVALQLQQMALKLGDACWTAKHSNCGFSISLYWPTPVSQVVKPTRFTQKKRRRRRKKKRPMTGTMEADRKSESCDKTPFSAHPERCCSEGAVGEEEGDMSQSGDSQLSVEGVLTQSGSTDADREGLSQSSCDDGESQCCDDESVSSEGEPGVDLLECNEVCYEKRDDRHGVNFRYGDEKGWTPVKRKRGRHKPTVSKDDSDSDLEAKIPKNASVCYCDGGGTPCFRVRTSKTLSWLPISTRTRSKLKT